MADWAYLIVISGIVLEVIGAMLALSPKRRG